MRYQLRLFVRSPRAPVASVATPLVLLALLAAITDHAEEPGYHAGLTASMVTLGIASTCYTTLAASLIASRDAGVLKRLRATPLPVWRHVTGRVLATVVVAVAQALLVTAVALAAFGARARPADVGWSAAGLLLGPVTVGLIGVAIAQVVPRGDAAATLLSTTLLPVVLVSGVFFPVGRLPGWAAAIAEASPLTHLATLLGASPAGWTDAAWLLGWAAAALLFTLWRFRFEPAPARERRLTRPAA